MKRSITPYSGGDKYIFVSYCHKDKDRVYPVIAALMNEGFRIWYDEGVSPGSDWPEVIAEHLEGCSLCVAFVSKSSVSSHNCRNEINFSLFKKKEMVIVMLDDVKLSLGMELQLSAVQAVLAYKDGTDVADMLRRAEPISVCKGEKPISGYVPFYANDEKKTDDIDGNTGALYLERDISGQCIKWKTKLVIGRAEDCGYPIDVSDISSHHAAFYREDQRIYVVDDRSTNGTYVNERLIPKKVKVELFCGDKVRLSNESFTVKRGTFYNKKVLCIEYIKKGQIYRFADKDKIIIGSDPDICDICIPDNTISRQHLFVEKGKDKIYITDNHSTNGSSVWGKRLISDKRAIVADSVAVSLADEYIHISYAPDAI